MVISSDFKGIRTFWFFTIPQQPKKASPAESNSSRYISWRTFHYFCVIDSVHSIISNEIWNNIDGRYRRCWQGYFNSTYFSKVLLTLLLFCDFVFQNLIYEFQIHGYRFLHLMQLVAAVTPQIRRPVYWLHVVVLLFWKCINSSIILFFTKIVLDFQWCLLWKAVASPRILLVKTVIFNKVGTKLKKSILGAILVTSFETEGGGGATALLRFNDTDNVKFSQSKL